MPSKPNPFCSVRGCKTGALHADDPTVAGLMKMFAAPKALAYWSFASMADLRDSIIRDMEEGRLFAWQTRLRQIEEIYFKTLYCAFFATEGELPHIFSGMTPNSIMPMYRKVNEEILMGNGQWENSESGGTSGQATPVSMLHSSAHASYAAMMTAISLGSFPKAQSEMATKYIQHLNIYCGRLEYMHKMFEAGREKQTVLEAFINMHRPISHWQQQSFKNADDS